MIELLSFGGSHTFESRLKVAAGLLSVDGNVCSAQEMSPFRSESTWIYKDSVNKNKNQETKFNYIKVGI